jgi:hypothetical protein
MTHSDAGGEQDKENQDYLEQQLINEINDLSDQITTANSRGETEKKLSRLASARALAISSLANLRMQQESLKQTEMLAQQNINLMNESAKASSELAETSHKIQKISNQTAIAVGIITGIAAVVAVGLQYLEYNLIKQTQDLENKVQVSEEQRK